LSQESRFGWVQLQNHTFYFVVKSLSGQKFTRLLLLNAGGIVFDHVSDFRYRYVTGSRDIRDQILKVCKINHTKFCLFLAPNVLGAIPEFLGLHFKAYPNIDHVAKFHGERQRDLGDPVAK